MSAAYHKTALCAINYVVTYKKIGEKKKKIDRLRKEKKAVPE